MKTSHAIFAIALTAATLGGSAFAAPSTDNGDKASAQADWLAIPAIYEKVTAAGYSDINEIERERDGYKIKAYDSNGDRVKLLVDPISGEVLESKSKKAKSDKRRSERTDINLDRGSDALPNDAK